MNAQIAKAEEGAPAAHAVRKLEAQYGGSIATKTGHADFAGDWIHPYDAVVMLTSAFGNREAAKGVIADLLLDGFVSARASKSWTISSSSLNDAWRGRNDGDEEPDLDVELTKATWRKSKTWSSDRLQWRWPEGRFVLTVSTRPKTWRFLEGVALNTHDLASHTPNSGRAEQPKRRRGPSPDLVRWARFWMEVVELERQGKLNRSHLQSQDQLILDLQEAMGSSALGKRSLEQFAPLIWERFVAKD